MYKYYLIIFILLSYQLTNAQLVQTKLFNQDSSTANSQVEIEIENSNYLYAFPPYPLPASKEVRSLIYWDTSIDINDDEKSIYNIYGLKIQCKDKLRIDKLNQYSGNLIWDCSSVESGIYLIYIKHGTTSVTIKVIVSR